MEQAVREKLRLLPDQPGVYLFKDGRNQVIYVGKARSLKNRVASYFRGPDERVFSPHLVRRIADLDFVVTDTEKEALILENNLIKQFKPRFNINLKDDKSFLSLRINVNEDYPRLEIVRRCKDDGALYFGPYSSASAVRHTVRYLNSLFPLRKCKDTVLRRRVRPCLYGQLGKCLGPCSGSTPEQYSQVVQQVVLFLKGRMGELLEHLKSEMAAAAERLEFERAARIRDQVQAIEKTVERQKISSPYAVNRDVFGVYLEDQRLTVFVMFVRNGKLEDFKPYFVLTRGLPIREALGSFLQQFYGLQRFIPEEVLLPMEVEGGALLAEWLSEMKQRKVELVTPQRGEKSELIELANQNAEQAYRLGHATVRDAEGALRRLQETLHLSKLPVHVECFDISNFSGKAAVGSLVSFENGKPNKARYRRFKIELADGKADDVGMLREVLTRRFRRASKDQTYPELVVVDGGRGQLNAALRVLSELAIKDVEVISLAKSRRVVREERQRKVRSDERVFVPGRQEPIVLRADSAELHFLDRVRDEAHRFAVSYHRKLRASPYRRSLLDGIRGLGVVRKRALLRHFESVERIRQASVEEIAQVPGISQAVAEAVHAHLHPS